ncbi:hypothetical protein HS088_TW10G00054 [Tripterygium wilfordii]|uniref:Uncharacterized protein n=1 Tax=Tripterygium wilfordii TaxID=458696 RepID=A0A7J7D471_TRIWF|nr:uncharacterized protein LOC120007575 [Tripterygium wilfordii]KAF5741059.1 hypothetical protein HS088_TW10G00054 [Tripterygium wilfordii]
MAKRGNTKKGPKTQSISRNSITLREETSGKKQQIKGGLGTHKSKSLLKIDHLRSLAVWASSEGAIPSLGALFGYQFAAAGEALGALPDPSLFSCQRCESILQPGFNCSVRVETNQDKKHRRAKKPGTMTQNSVVYACHFCSHRNLKRGTPKGHMKEICPPTPKRCLESKPVKSVLQKHASSEEALEEDKYQFPIDQLDKTDEIALPKIASNDNPATPSVRTGISLLYEKRRKRSRSGLKPPAESGSISTMTNTENTSASGKRKRKAWTSLKEIAEQGSNQKSNIAIPFVL